jgi:hypothetical protein
VVALLALAPSAFAAPVGDADVAGTVTPTDVVSATAPAPIAKPRLPVVGLAADVGIPDGANLSAVARPRPWVRLHAGVGSNSISYGWRIGATWLPLGQGPSLEVDYGHYAEGNANALARRIVGSGFQSSPVLDRVGYDYLNLHLGLNLGIERVVVFLQGGISSVHGRVHNLDQVVSQATGNSATVVVHQEPTFRATGASFRAGLIAFVW